MFTWMYRQLSLDYFEHITNVIKLRQVIEVWVSVRVSYIRKATVFYDFQVVLWTYIRNGNRSSESQINSKSRNVYMYSKCLGLTKL